MRHIDDVLGVVRVSGILTETVMGAFQGYAAIGSHGGKRERHPRWGSVGHCVLRECCPDGEAGSVCTHGQEEPLPNVYPLELRVTRMSGSHVVYLVQFTFSKCYLHYVTGIRYINGEHSGPSAELCHEARSSSSLTARWCTYSGRRISRIITASVTPGPCARSMRCCNWAFAGKP